MPESASSTQRALGVSKLPPIDHEGVVRRTNGRAAFRKLQLANTPRLLQSSPPVLRRGEAANADKVNADDAHQQRPTGIHSAADVFRLAAQHPKETAPLPAPLQRELLRSLSETSSDSPIFSPPGSPNRVLTFEDAIRRLCQTKTWSTEEALAQLMVLCTDHNITAADVRGLQQEHAVKTQQAQQTQQELQALLENRTQEKQQLAENAYRYNLDSTITTHEQLRAHLMQAKDPFGEQIIALLDAHLPNKLQQGPLSPKYLETFGEWIHSDAMLRYEQALRMVKINNDSIDLCGQDGNKFTVADAKAAHRAVALELSKLPLSLLEYGVFQGSCRVNRNLCGLLLC